MPANFRQIRRGGPRTEQGKLVASKNATKIGIYTNQVVLPDEDPSDFAALEALFVADFDPVGLTESTLVRDLAVLTWKRRRLERIEHRQIAHYLTAPVTKHELHMLGITLMEGVEDYVVNPEQIDGWDVRKLQQSVLGLEKILLDFIDAKSLIQLRKTAPDAYKQLSQKMEQVGHLYPTPESMAEIESNDPFSADWQGTVRRQCKALVFELNQKLWVAMHRQIILDVHERLRDSRLASSVTSERNERAHDHLSRSFYKTLTELRKQQDWRRQQQVIDVTPEPTPLAA